MQFQALVEEMTAGGPSASGDGGRPFQSDSNVEELDNTKLQRVVTRNHGIVNTKAPMVAYNGTTVNDERGVLLHRLLRYGEEGDSCLKPIHTSVLEYAELVIIAHASERDAEVLRNLVVYGFGSRIRPGEFLDENTAKALFSTLTWVDFAVYDDTAQLMHLVSKLLW